MNNNLEKFKKICKDKGLFAGLIKSLSYLIFISKSNRLENLWKHVFLTSGGIKIKGWNTGPVIFWNNIELTKSAGLNTSIFINGKWHDSSKARWSPEKAGRETLILKNRWKTLPICQTWIISNIGEGKILCEVKLDAIKDLEFIEQKFTVMLSEKFNLWIDDSNKAICFPQFKDWADVKDVKKNTIFIGAQSDIDKDLPSVILSKQDSQAKAYPEIQNSDFKTRARLLNFVLSSRDVDLKYKKGESCFFKMEIKIG